MMHETTDTITLPRLLAELADDLSAAASVAKAAAACAQNGAVAEAMRVAICLDVALGEAQTLHSAIVLIARRRRRRGA